MRLDIREPGVEGALEPQLLGVIAEQLLAPDFSQLGKVALEQARVQVPLGSEVPW